MTDEENRFPPALLFRSFLLVASAYMLNAVLLGLIGIILLRLAFTDSFEILNKDPDQFNVIFAEDPDQVFPPEFLWTLLAISVPICIAMGYMVARLAQLAKFPHAILFSVILFVQYLQLAIGATGTLQRMLVLFMAASPIAAMIGANLYLKRDRQLQKNEESIT